MNEKWFVIINRVSGGKKGPKRWHKIKPVLDGGEISYEFSMTEYIDHASKICANAINRGYRNFMIIGEDRGADESDKGLGNGLAK